MGARTDREQIENLPVSERMGYRPEEAFRLIGIGRQAGYQAIHSGQIPSVRIGKRLIVPRAGLEKLLAGAAPVETPRESGAL